MLDARHEPGVRLAGVLAVVVHVLALLALGYGFHIQQPRQEPVMAELWTALPPVAPPRPTAKPTPTPVPTPVPKPAPRPPPPPPEPKVKPEPKPAPKPEPKLEPKGPSKADIELKEKAALAAKAAKAAQQAEAEKRKLEQAAKQAEAETRKLEAAKQRELEKLKALALQEERARLAEADRLRRDQEDLVRKATEAAASAQAKMLASYVDKIRGKVRRFIVEPPGVLPTAAAEFDVVLIPGGDVLSVRLRRSSGNPLYDEAVERAIRRAEPLPIPPDPQLFSRFRELDLKISPQQQ